MTDDEDLDVIPAGLSLPPPEKITRVTLIKMRQRLLALRNSLSEEHRSLQVNTNRGAHGRAYSRVGRFPAWSRGRSTGVPAFSWTKAKRERERHARNKGKPFFQREEAPDSAFVRMGQISDMVAQINAVLADIAERLPNLVDEPVLRKRKPLIPPSVDEF